jgi:chromate reductase, NAD(P)H dehydrogenase (quinone)
MAAPLAVLAFAGSLRTKSLNRALLRAALDLAPVEMQVTIYDLASLPLYNADLDGEEMPSSVAKFKAAVGAADALLIACPEYNYSVTGVLKNALDWVSRGVPSGTPAPLQGKPAAILGAGGRFGTVRAQAHLRYILLHNDVKVLNKPEVMLPRASEHFSADGQLQSEEIREQLSELLRGLAHWTRLLSGTIAHQIA